MNRRRENNLILIENGIITSVALDDKNNWKIGRPSKDNIPDIKLHSSTVSRKHGMLQNIDGVWFFWDYNGKNGTIYNHKYLRIGIQGRYKPVPLEDGDTFVFGGGEEEVINCKTVWAMFVTETFDGDWRIVDTRGCDRLQFVSDDESVTMEAPQKGFVFKKRTGIAIYMGDLTYLIGNVDVLLC